MNQRLLFIETDGSLSQTLGSFFSEKGFEIDTASNQEEAWQKIAEYRYMYIFYNLKGGSSEDLDFIGQIRSRIRMPAQIFVAGPNDVGLAVNAMQNGARHYWVNPLKLDDVVQMYNNGSLSLAHSQSGFQREETLLQIIKEISLTMELDGLVNILMDSAMELTGADAGALFLLDEKSNTLVTKAIRGLSTPENQIEYFGLSEREYSEILRNRQPVFLHHLKEPLYTSNRQLVNAVIVVPLWWKDEPMGVLVNVKFSDTAQSFSNDDYNLISLLAEEISGAVYNAITHHRTKELTIKDDLTEAYNRRYFEKYLEDEFMRARRYGANLSLIFFDVDNLKEVNVKHGHLVGSKTLQEVARRMILTVRGIDKVVRYGGDEFCVVLPETDTQGAYQVADRIRNTVASKPFYLNENTQITLTGSIGIASFPVHCSSKEELIRQADKAMFVIKNRTKNAIAVAEVPSH